MTRLLFSFLACAAIARADFDPAHWQLRRTITLESPQAVATFAVDQTLYRGSLDRLTDIRILRDGKETAYLVRTLSGSSEQREFRPTILNKSVSATGLEATLDLGGRQTHNHLTIVTNQTNFKQRVRIETSDNGRTWALARGDGYIFDFSQGERQVSELTVDYPVSNRRFVKLTIYGWTSPDYLQSASLTYFSETNGIFDPVATVVPSVTEDAKTQSTVLVADIGFSSVPHDRVQLSIDPGLFYRTVEIETSIDGKYWAYAGQGVISRTAEIEGTTLSFPEQWDRYLRLRILNQDNPPLEIRRAIFSGVRRTVEFPATAAGQYVLYYGNADAKQPQYDFVHTMPDKSTPASAKLGAEEPNPAYQKPKPPEVPWSDQHPGILYTVLIVAILGMGFFAVTFLLKLKR
jgi:hypothetical protein